MAPRDDVLLPRPSQSARHPERPCHPERSEGSQPFERRDSSPAARNDNGATSRRDDQPRETRSTCPYCGVGCGVIVESQGTAITGVRGDPEHPANFGRLCTKGSTLHLTAAPKTLAHRLLWPQRRPVRGGPTERINWDAAIAYASSAIAATVERYGPDSVGLYISGQLLTEDYYVFNKLAKGLLGTNNIDTNSRLCMSSAVAGYKRTLGADTVPACYEDIDHARTFFVTGANMAYAHPVLFRRIEDAKRARPDTKLIVVDPRRTDTAAAADLHLQVQPGTDVALHHALLHLLLWEDRIDRDYIAAHVDGFEALRDRVRTWTPARAAQTCGLKEADIVTAARWFAVGPTLSLYCQGLNQSSQGTAKNGTLINLHLATGQIGKPGAGPLSLTGQPNAMGGREVGGMAHLLSGHRDLANAEHRAEVARLWHVPDVPSRPGLAAVDMFEAARAGKIKLLWIVATNPAASLPNQAGVREALRRCETVIVQEAFANAETNAYADLLLPAATWGEKNGTVTNSERRISRQRAAVAPPSGARADWQIAVDIARAVESRLRPNWPTLFQYATAEDVFVEHRATTVGRDLDIGGMSYALLDRDGPQQWPQPAAASHGTARLFGDGRFATASGRARFDASDYVPPAQKVDSKRPFALLTGRLRDHWHTMTRTGVAPRLFAHAPAPGVDVAAVDVARRGWTDGAFLRVSTAHGQQILPLHADDTLASGQAFVAMHWGSGFVAGRDAAGVNGLTSPAADATSKQPELKYAAARLEPVELPWRLVACARCDDLATLEAALRPVLVQVDYAALVPFGRDADALGLSLAARAAPDESVLEHIERSFGFAAANVLRYDDARRHARRRMRFDAGGQLAAVLVSGDAATVAQGAWLREAIAAGDVLGTQSLRVLSTLRRPAQSRSRGRVVCNCFDVAESQIAERLAACSGSGEQRLAQLQGDLRCGTQCGSCLPELRRMIAALPQPQAVAA